METMPERLKHLRTALLNLTQPDFAAKISLKSASIVHHMETGARTITDRTIKTICSEFHVNENWLKNGFEPIFTMSIREQEKDFDLHGGYKGHSFSDLTGLEGDSYRKAFRMLLDIFESPAAAKYQHAIMANLDAFTCAIKTEERITALEQQVSELKSIVQQQSRIATDRRRIQGVNPNGPERRSGHDRRGRSNDENGNSAEESTA